MPGLVNHVQARIRALQSEEAYRCEPTESLVDLITLILANNPLAVENRSGLATHNAEIEAKWKDREILWYKGKMYLPEAVRVDVLARRHENLLAGHPGVEKTL